MTARVTRRYVVSCPECGARVSVDVESSRPDEFVYDLVNASDCVCGGQTLDAYRPVDAAGSVNQADGAR